MQRHTRELDAAIKRKGLEELYDIRHNIAPSFVTEAADQLLERRPRIVGFTSMFEQTAASLAIAAAVKERDPSVIVCFGGANCHGPMGAVLLKNYFQIDYVFTGEADAVFGPVVEVILGGDRPPAMPGCLSRDQSAATAAVPVTAMDAADSRLRRLFPAGCRPFRSGARAALDSIRNHRVVAGGARSITAPSAA